LPLFKKLKLDAREPPIFKNKTLTLIKGFEFFKNKPYPKVIPKNNIKRKPTPKVLPKIKNQPTLV
jgi:hypothetical protein